MNLIDDFLKPYQTYILIGAVAIITLIYLFQVNTTDKLMKENAKLKSEVATIQEQRTELFRQKIVLETLITSQGLELKNETKTLQEINKELQSDKSALDATLNNYDNLNSNSVDKMSTDELRERLKKLYPTNRK